MKNVFLILAMCLVAKFSFARTVQPSIDDDLDFKMETDYRESERGVAAFNEQKEEEKSKEEKEKKNGEDRDVASDEEVFDSTNENGIRYWKY